MAKHPHADLIKQMVDDDTLRAECKNWGTGDYGLKAVITCPENDWRLVQPKPKTITIVANGKTYELPEPMRVAPGVGNMYYVFTTTARADCSKWESYDYERRWLSDGICHVTREAAQAWVDAMAEIRGAK